MDNTIIGEDWKDSVPAQLTVSDIYHIIWRKRATPLSASISPTAAWKKFIEDVKACRAFIGTRTIIVRNLYKERSDQEPIQKL